MGERRCSSSGIGANCRGVRSNKKALAIFPESAFVHSLRGNLFAEAGFLHEAEREHLVSAALESNGTTWSSLGAIYHRQGRLMEEIDAWQRAGALLSYSAPELLALGYAELAARRPQKALQTFDKAGLAGARKIIRSRATARRRAASEGTCRIDQSRTGVADQTALTALKLNHRPGFLPVV
jgi:tetratricopeptide (TPR) repeat protein